MMNFKQRDELLPSTLILLAILILIGTLVYMLVVPVPTAAGLAKGREVSRRQIEKEIKEARERTVQLQKSNEPRLWSGDPERVTANVLGQLTQATNRRGLKLGAFRPQKIQNLEGVDELPFSVQIAGSYTDVQAVVATLDAEDSKIAVRSVQIAASDAASSLVTATLGISAYLPASESSLKPSTTAVATASRGTTQAGEAR